MSLFKEVKIGKITYKGEINNIPQINSYVYKRGKKNYIQPWNKILKLKNGKGVEVKAKALSDKMMVDTIDIILDKIIHSDNWFEFPMKTFGIKAINLSDSSALSLIPLDLGIIYVKMVPYKISVKPETKKRLEAAYIAGRRYSVVSFIHNWERIIKTRGILYIKNKLKNGNL